MDFYENYEGPPSPFPVNPREHVRKRPSMYIGGTDVRGLHHLIYEVLDHMVEEAFVGRCSQIQIELHPDNEVELRDNSGGLSTRQYKDTPFTDMEILLQDLSTSKHDLEPDVYQATGGLHGLGLAIVNILCDRFEVENYRDDIVWKQAYAHGKPISPVTRIPVESVQETGTKFIIHPDYAILDENAFELARVQKRAQEVAFLTPGLQVTVKDIRLQPEYETTFCFPDGLKTLISQVNTDSNPFHEPIHIFQNVVINQSERPDFEVAIHLAFQFTDGDKTYLRGYANTVETPDGGTHLMALKSALLSCLDGHMETYPVEFGKQPSLTWEEVSVGLAAVVSIHHPDPQFVSPTKVQLSNGEIYGPISGLVFDAFNGLFSGHQSKVLDIIVRHHLSRRDSQMMP